jgi:hypothetical protein
MSAAARDRPAVRTARSESNSEQIDTRGTIVDTSFLGDSGHEVIDWQRAAHMDSDTVFNSNTPHGNAPAPAPAPQTCPIRPTGI